MNNQQQTQEIFTQKQRSGCVLIFFIITTIFFALTTCGLSIRNAQFKKQLGISSNNTDSYTGEDPYDSNGNLKSYVREQEEQKQIQEEEQLDKDLAKGLSRAAKILGDKESMKWYKECVKEYGEDHC